MTSLTVCFTRRASRIRARARTLTPSRTSDRRSHSPRSVRPSRDAAQVRISLRHSVSRLTRCAGVDTESLKVRRQGCCASRMGVVFDLILVASAV